MKKQTALQELIIRLGLLKEQFKFMDNSDLDACSLIATDLLSKEREQIEEAHLKGIEYQRGFTDHYDKEESESYFIKTYIIQ